MEAQIETLGRKIVAESKRKQPGERLLVAIAGPPGSGKSTVVDPLLAKINALLDEGDVAKPGETREESAICVSLDGWHMYRHELDAMPDPQEAHWRRGAAFTFDQHKYLAFVRALRTSSPEPIPFFTFDHALKDPSPSDKPVTTNHKIVIVEGLYTLLDRPGWREAADMMDIRVWIEVDREVARRRLVERNFAAGISATKEDTAVRVDVSDMLNGEDVRANRVDPTDVVHSIDSPRIP